MERTITIENDEVKPDLEKRKEVIEEGQKTTEKIEELQEKRKKLGMKAQKLQDKVQDPIIEQVKEKTELDEFEYMASVKIEEGEIVVTIADQLEEVKERLRKQREDEE